MDIRYLIHKKKLPTFDMSFNMVFEIFVDKI